MAYLVFLSNSTPFEVSCNEKALFQVSPDGAVSQYNTTAQSAQCSSVRDDDELFIPSRVSEDALIQSRRPKSKLGCITNCSSRSSSAIIRFSVTFGSLRLHIA